MKLNLKIYLALLSITFLFVNDCLSQSCYVSTSNYCDFPMSPIFNTSKKRVLFVDHFLKFINNDYSIGVNTNSSILGVDDNQDQDYEIENQLLNYARDNNFTSIILYDLHNVFDYRSLPYLDGSSRTDNYEENLKRFIIKAKTGGYGITEVSAAIGGFEYPQEIQLYNGSPDDYNCTLSYGEIDSTSVVPHPHNWDQFDYLAECINVIKGIHNYNVRIANEKFGKASEEYRNGKNITCYPDGVIDRLVTEYEFWNFPFHGESNSDEDFLNFQVLIGNMKCAQLNSICPLGVDSYIGWPALNGSNTGQFSANNEVNWIDANVDRNYVHVYKCDPNNSFSQGRTRLEYYGTNSVLNSKVYPIFSAEDVSLYDNRFPELNHDYFLGLFLTDNSVSFNPQGGYTLACAESRFLFDYTSNSSGWNNNIEGYAWFTYNVLNNNPVHQILRERKIEKKVQININENDSKIEIYSVEPVDFNIYDLQGKIILKNSIRANSIIINKSDLPIGIFLIKVTSLTNFEQKIVHTIK